MRSRPQAARGAPRLRAVPPERGERASWLLARAASVFAEKGYHDTSMRDLARAARCSLAGLYHYFGSKEELLFEIQWGSFSTLLARQEEVVAAGGGLEEQLAAIVRNHLEFFTRNAAELKVCTYELESLGGEPYRRIAELRRRYYLLVQEIVRGIRGRRVPEVQVRHDTLFLFGALNWVFMWFDPEKDGPAADLGEELVSLVLHGLTHAPAGRRATRG